METSMILLEIISIVFFSLVMIKATDTLIKIIILLSSETGIKTLVLSSILVALATSLPEIAVGITSALEGKPILSLGNVLGSNIADIGLVGGMAAIVSRGLVVRDPIIFKNALATSFLIVSPMVLLLDGMLSRLDSVFLLIIYILYEIFVGKSIGKQLPKKERRSNLSRIMINIGVFIIFSLILILSASMVVKSASLLAENLKIPLFLVSLLLVAVGTSLPELTFELEAARFKKGTIIFGDLLGSLAVNSTLALGLTGLIAPFSFSVNEFLPSAFFLILIFGLFLFFIITKKKLSLVEGAILVASYFIFVIIQLS